MMISLRFETTISSHQTPMVVVSTLPLPLHVMYVCAKSTILFYLLLGICLCVATGKTIYLCKPKLCRCIENLPSRFRSKLDELSGNSVQTNHIFVLYE